MFGLLLFSIFLLSEIRLRASPLGPWSHQQQLCMCLNGEEEDISINADLRNGNIFHSDVINYFHKVKYYIVIIYVLNKKIIVLKSKKIFFKVKFPLVKYSG